MKGKRKILTERVVSIGYCNRMACRVESVTVAAYAPRDAEKVFEAPLPPNCPECGKEWSSQCPFCLQALDVTWREALPLCSHCLVGLKAGPPGGSRESEHQ